MASFFDARRAGGCRVHHVRTTRAFGRGCRAPCYMALVFTPAGSGLGCGRGC